MFRIIWGSAAVLAALFLWVLGNVKGRTGLRAWVQVIADEDMPIHAGGTIAQLCVTAADPNAPPEQKRQHFSKWRAVVHDSVQSERQRRKRSKDITATVASLFVVIVFAAICFVTYLVLSSETIPPSPWSVEKARIFAYTVFPWGLSIASLSWFGLQFLPLVWRHGPPRSGK